MVKINVLFTVLFLFETIALFGQNFNRPVPTQIPPYEFVQYDSSAGGYYLATPFSLSANAGASVLPRTVMILDSSGYLFWYMPLDARNLADFKYYPAHQLYTFVKFKGPKNAQCLVMDPDFKIVDSFTTVNGILPDAHDFQISANKTYLVAGASDSIMDLSAYLFGGVPGSPNTHAIGFVVQEFDEDHNLLFQWNSNDHIHPTAGYAFYGYAPAAFDYCHGNTIAEDSDGNLLLSFRHLNAVYKIDRQTGNIIWQLGGKNSSFSFPNDPGFSGQHDIRRLPNGNVSLFDNANMAPPPRISRAVEYTLDTLNWTAVKVWEYKYTPPFFSPAMGNHQTTADRQHLIHYGLNYRPSPTFVRTDDQGNRISELFLADTFMSYRSFLFDLPVDHIQRPVITCSQDGGIITLSAPAGFDRYEWSTGEKSGSITVQDTGAYQVWVSRGMGMLGSEPFFIQDLDHVCPLSGTDAAAVPESRTITGYYDLLGREMPPPPYPGTGSQIYIVRYADGQAILKVY